MGVAVKLYEQLAEAVDDQTRIRLLAEAIGQLEERWPTADEIPRRHDLRETELRLQKEIETVRKEIEIVRGENKDMELRLQREIEGVRKEIEIVRKEIKDLDLRLQKEIEGVRKEIKDLELRLQKEIEGVRREIKELELRLSKEIKQVELQVQEARIEIKATEASLRMAIHRQTLWVVGAVGTVVGLIRVLEWLLP
ncbi:MAG: hypothetical protein VBE63_10785 [Lamprobacter sp.]|uniref:hypothetical protein n=1 Tax=Lamprobacter sp. TaxID=3100796 RepID=UPI002B260B93|nr:hypothetical protein [Lamprobacter sp.]MEA3640418.1 hypothetical protein [Lamprobacter sp.]